jgi:glycosyltransferase involved in cell wall biosynthesis
MLSLIIPVYKNEQNLERLLARLVELAAVLPGELEVVFVVDGSPDRSHEILGERLPHLALRWQLIALTRNFGSFSAVRAGLQSGQGDYFAVLAADLQEPPELIVEFLEAMNRGEADIVFGVRSARSDPWFSKLVSNAFWSFYRRAVVGEIPSGGVDIFGCTRAVRDRVVEFREVSTNLIALLFWIGYKRKFIKYDRAPRLEGKSAWTFRKKLQYGLDSVLNFTDLPIKLLSYIGALGMFAAIAIATTVLIAKTFGRISVPGYTAVVLVITFFGGLTSFGLGILGQYLWLILQNVRRRPNFIVGSTRASHVPAASVQIEEK